MAVGPGGIMYLPKGGQRMSQGMGGKLNSPFAQQIQQLAAQLGGGGGNAGFMNGNVPAPNLPAGTYQGAYAAQGLRTSNPQQAAQLWESRHPAAMRGGNVPPWVMQAMGNSVGGGVPGNQMDPHEVLHNVVSAHRQANGLPPMHPEDLHARVTSLAHEILNGRQNRLQQALGGIRPPAPPQQVAAPFQAQ